MSYFRNIEWNEEVTIYHKSESLVDGKKIVSWEKSVYEGCFWSLKSRQSLDGRQIVVRSNFIVRIPTDMNEGVELSIGDIAVKGNIQESIGSTPTALMTKYEGSCFYINSVTDNTKLPRTAHWLISDRS